MHAVRQLHGRVPLRDRVGPSRPRRLPARLPVALGAAPRALIVAHRRPSAGRRVTRPATRRW